MTTIGTLTIPVRSVEGPARGAKLGVSEGRMNGAPFTVTLTEQELHFAFADRDGPSFSVDMNALAKAATDAIEEAMTGKRRMIG